MANPVPDLIIGRLASLEGPPAELREWVQKEHGAELFIVPLIASTPINDAIRLMQTWGYDRAAIVTARLPAGNEYRLSWLAVKPSVMNGAPNLFDEPMSQSITLAELLDMSSPLMPTTVTFEGEELCFRSDESPNVIDDESDVDALRAFLNTP